MRGAPSLDLQRLRVLDGLEVRSESAPEGVATIELRGVEPPVRRPEIKVAAGHEGVGIVVSVRGEDLLGRGGVAGGCGDRRECEEGKGSGQAEEDEAGLADRWSQ